MSSFKGRGHKKKKTHGTAQAKKPSSTLLPKLLRERNKEGRYDAMIELAEKGGYDDYKFLHVIPDCQEACPKVMLDKHLAQYPELSDIRQMIREGKFDDEGDADDRAEMRRDLEAQGTSEAFMKLLGL